MGDAEFTAREENILEMLLGPPICLPDGGSGFGFWYQFGLATILTILLLILVVLPINIGFRILLFWIGCMFLDFLFQNYRENHPKCPL